MGINYWAYAMTVRLNQEYGTSLYFGFNNNSGMHRRVFYVGTKKRPHLTL
jgi:hypothetical protein